MRPYISLNFCAGKRYDEEGVVKNSNLNLALLSSSMPAFAIADGGVERSCRMGYLFVVEMGIPLHSFNFSGHILAT